jgi:hypothetical protein
MAEAVVSAFPLAGGPGILKAVLPEASRKSANTKIITAWCSAIFCMGGG